MNLIYISPSPPNEMERARTLNILKSLKENGTQITLITLYNKSQTKYLEEAKEYVDEIIKIRYSKIIAIIYAFISIFLPIPARVGYCFSFKLRRYLKNNKIKYDVAYIKRLRLAQYKKYINADKKYIDITDSLTKYYERLYKNEKTIKKLFYLEEYIKLKKYEIKICEENENIIICSEDDKKYIEKVSPKTRGHINVIENVLDVSKWKKENIQVKEKGKRTNLVFMGVMDYKPNVEAVKYIIEKIMPKLNSEYNLKIIGPKVSKNLKELETDRIKFLGYVKSVKDEFEKSDIFICPLKIGAGTKNKIIQAGMSGLPIICTTLALEGLDKELKNLVYIAESKSDFINKIKEIQDMENEKLKEKIEMQQKIIETQNSLNTIKTKLYNLL